MNLTYHDAGERIEELEEHEARIQSSVFEELMGHKASKGRLKPWKQRVVRLTVKGDSVYRVVRCHGSLSIPKDTVWLGRRTSYQLGVADGATVEVEKAWPLLGRFYYYNTHLDESVRFSFRIGFWGLIFAVFSLVLSILPLLSRH